MEAQARARQGPTAVGPRISSGPQGRAPAAKAKPQQPRFSNQMLRQVSATRPVRLGAPTQRAVGTSVGASTASRGLVDDDAFGDAEAAPSQPAGAGSQRPSSAPAASRQQPPVVQSGAMSQAQKENLSQQAMAKRSLSSSGVAASGFQPKSKLTMREVAERKVRLGGTIPVPRSPNKQSWQQHVSTAQREEAAAAAALQRDRSAGLAGSSRAKKLARDGLRSASPGHAPGSRSATAAAGQRVAGRGGEEFMALMSDDEDEEEGEGDGEVLARGKGKENGGCEGKQAPGAAPQVDAAAPRLAASSGAGGAKRAGGAGKGFAAKYGAKELSGIDAAKPAIHAVRVFPRPAAAPFLAG